MRDLPDSFSNVCGLKKKRVIEMAGGDFTDPRNVDQRVDQYVGHTDSFRSQRSNPELRKNSLGSSRRREVRLCLSKLTHCPWQ